LVALPNRADNSVVFLQEIGYSLGGTVAFCQENDWHILLRFFIRRENMDRKDAMELFNKRPRIGTLSTSNKSGDVNVAIFGSPQMIDENTVVMGIGANRSFQYLQENPNAVFIVMEPGETLMDWKGCRVYLLAQTIDTAGDLYNQIKSKIAEAAGEAAAKMIHAAIQFKVTDVRALIAPPQ
jgi:hypothetical protein